MADASDIDDFPCELHPSAIGLCLATVEEVVGPCISVTPLSLGRRAMTKIRRVRIVVVGADHDDQPLPEERPALCYGRGT